MQTWIFLAINFPLSNIIFCWKLDKYLKIFTGSQVTTFKFNFLLAIIYFFLYDFLSATKYVQENVIACLQLSTHFQMWFFAGTQVPTLKCDFLLAMKFSLSILIFLAFNYPLSNITIFPEIMYPLSNMAFCPLKNTIFCNEVLTYKREFFLEMEYLLLKVFSFMTVKYPLSNLDFCWQSCTHFQIWVGN